MSATRKKILMLLSSPAWVAFVWFGMTAGISMLATPVRFASQTMTRPVALDVARVVFAALNKAEIIALIILLIVVRAGGHARKLWAACAALALILLAQSVWLLPELSARTDLVIAGIEPAASMVHGIYSALEICKLVLLLLIGFRALAVRPANGH
jgi:hypothetical protein